MLSFVMNLRMKKSNIKIDSQSTCNSETKSNKILGVYIDDSVNWKKHLVTLLRKFLMDMSHSEKQKISQRGQFIDFI